MTLDWYLQSVVCRCAENSDFAEDPALGAAALLAPRARRGDERVAANFATENQQRHKHVCAWHGIALLLLLLLLPSSP